MHELLQNVLLFPQPAGPNAEAPEGAPPAGADLYVCQNCADANRNPVVSLDRFLRCDVCGSDAVASVARLEAARRRREACATFCQDALREMSPREEVQ